MKKNGFQNDRWWSVLIKTLIIMKLSIIILCLTVFSVSASETYAQNTKLSLSMRNVTIEDVLKSIEDKSEFRFFYTEKLPVDNKVSIDCDKKAIDEVLEGIFKGTDIAYRLVGRQVALYKNTSELSMIQAEQQNTVSGKVTDSSGIGLPGVSVVIKGTTKGITTDANGNYSLTNIPANSTLQFSYVGMKGQEVAVGDVSTINVTLEDETIGIEEVVAIGYGSVKKSDLTGSVSSLKGDDLNSMSISGIDQVLQGKAAGVTVMSNSGSPGSGATIRIRGTGSINSGNDPLFVVDGLPVGNDVINLINPSDVERIEVLKDASSAAIYGSNGANGVILVTTKRGKVGAPKISFDAYQGTKSMSKNVEVGDAAQYAQVYLLGKKAAGAPAGDIVGAFKPYYSTLDGIDFTKDFSSYQNNLYNQLKAAMPNSTNWWKEIIHIGKVQNYNLSINGGSESFKYASSVSYYDETGMIRTAGFKRLTFRLNSDYTVNKKLKLGTNFTLVNSQRQSVSENSGESMIADAFLLDPISLVTRTREQTILDGGNPDNPLDLYSPSLYTNRTNPIARLARNNGNYSQLQIMGNGFVEYTIFKGLSFKSSIGIILSRGLMSNFTPTYYLNTVDRNEVNMVSRSNDVSNSWNWINQLSYYREFGKHSITAMVATDASHYEYEGFSASKQNVPSNDVNLRYLSLATLNATVNDGVNEKAMMSYLGRVNYAFANKYLVTATYRRDGSSNFAKGYRWGNFKSFSLGYKISEEAYFKNLNINAINNLKIRGGWGQLGNSNIPSFAYLSQYAQNQHISYPYGPSTTYTGGGIGAIPIQPLSQGILPSVIGNPEIKWETQEQTNVGIDLGLLQNKLTFTADYFIRTTKDNLIQEPIPSYVGYPQIPWSNAGKIENRGFEFSGEFNNKVGDFTYSIGGNISFIKNKVISLGKGSEIAAGFTRISGNGTVTKVGNPISDFIGYKTEGIFQTQEEVNNYKGTDGAVLQPNAKPGDFRFANLHNDNALNDSDRVVLGSPLPKFAYGFNVDLGYKGFELNMFFQGQYGNKNLMYEKYFLNTGEGYMNSVKDLPSSAWHGPGTSNSQPRITANDANLNYRMSDFYLEDGSYLRLKHIQLAYNLPKAICEKLKIGNAKVYVNGENLFTFTKYSGLDPELANSSIWSMGISQFGYPQPKTLTAGIKLGF